MYSNINNRQEKGAPMDCQVCCEKLNASTRKPIDCGWCEFVSCASCVQRFLLDLSDGPSCMSCKHLWDREFLESKLTKTFLNGPLKTHREEVLFEVEKGLLPETQPYAERMKQVLEMQDKKVLFNKAISDARKDYINTPKPRDGLELIAIERDYNVKMFKLKEDVSYVNKAITILKRRNAGVNTDDAANERRAFIKSCPSADCRGFLSTQWKCGLCSIKVCSKCHEIKGEPGDGNEHVCKPEDIATVEALAKDSKPCPKCGALIQRIEGCSQMFHTPLSGGCGAVFDWNTLRVHTGSEGAIHNPHWYEYQRHINNGNVPRQVGDMPCGGLPSTQEMNYTIIRLFAVKTLRDKWTLVTFSMHRGYNHNQHVMLPAYTVNLVGDNRDLRVDYLLNRVDEKKFKVTIQQREKAREKKFHIGQILRMYQTAVGDIMMRMSRATTPDELEATFNEVKELVVYTNESFKKAAKVYTCVEPYIDEKSFCLMTVKPKTAKA